MGWTKIMGEHRNYGRHWYGMDKAILETTETKGDIGM